MTDEAPIEFPLPAGPSIFHPSPQLVELQRTRPVAPVTMSDGTRAWLLTRYADVRRALVDPRFSRAAAIGPTGPSAELGALATETLIAMDPPEHTRLRRLVGSAFTPRRVERMRPWVADLVEDLLDVVEAQGPPADLVEHFSIPLPIEVISELLGIPEADRSRCKAWSDTMMSDWRADPDGTREALEGFAAVIEARRAEPADDLISALAGADDEHGRLTERELLMVCVGILIGGHETTTNQINMFVLTLRRNPEVLARLLAEPGEIPRAVEELSRMTQFDTTGVLEPRVTTEEVELSGVRLPKGATVLPALIIADRDPDVFPDPDTVNLARAANPHLGFGAGVHHCLGAQLARMELQEALRGLLRRFPDLRVTIPESELRFKPGMAVRSLESLPITW